MTKILNWGLLSTARINRALIPPLQVSKRNHLLAVASRSQAIVDAYAKEKKIERAYGSYEAMLADSDIDVIYNPLPNHLHAEWKIKAMAAGKHVLCEKPLALSVDEVDAIKYAAHNHRRRRRGSVHVSSSPANIEGTGDRQKRFTRDIETDPRFF